MKIDPIYGRIGAVIRSRRKVLDKTQEDLARELGISRGSLANIETGRQNVLVHQLYRIAAQLKLAPVDLLPQPATSTVRSATLDLPLPTDLKPKQRDQIAGFFTDPESATAIRSKETPRGKSGK